MYGDVCGKLMMSEVSDGWVWSMQARCRNRNEKTRYKQQAGRQARQGNTGVRVRTGTTRRFASGSPAIISIGLRQPPKADVKEDGGGKRVARGRKELIGFSVTRLTLPSARRVWRINGQDPVFTQPPQPHASALTRERLRAQSGHIGRHCQGPACLILDPSSQSRPPVLTIECTDFHLLSHSKHPTAMIRTLLRLRHRQHDDVFRRR